jgi:adenylate cyclase
MSFEEEKDPKLIEEAWRTYLTTGEVPGTLATPWFKSARLRPVFRRLPSEPRCRMCYYPFEGIGGTLMRSAFQITPSRMNPYLCNLCEQFAEKYQGGAEVEITIIFTDVRGSTRLAQSMPAAEYSQLINRYFNAVTKVLYDTGAMVEKLIGDAVTGFYTTGISGKNHARSAVKAARSILKATGHKDESGPWIPVGIGIHTGEAYVGSVQPEVGSTEIVVLGDTANTGARLSSAAGTGEIYLSQATARAAGLDPAEAEIRQVTLKGWNEPVEVWVI